MPTQNVIQPQSCMKIISCYLNHIITDMMVVVHGSRECLFLWTIVLYNNEVAAVCLWLELTCVTTAATQAWRTGDRLSDVSSTCWPASRSHACWPSCWVSGSGSHNQMSVVLPSSVTTPAQLDWVSFILTLMHISCTTDSICTTNSISRTTSIVWNSLTNAFSNYFRQILWMKV